MTKSTKVSVISAILTSIILAITTGKLAVFLSGFLFMLGSWQLDHFVAPYIWRHKGERIEVLPWLYLEVTTFYVVCFITLTIGFLVAIGGMIF